MVLLAFHPSGIGGGNRRRPVVEKPGRITYALRGVPPELGRGMMHDAVYGTVRVVDGLLESLSTLLGSDVRHDIATGGPRFLVIDGTYWVMPRDLSRELENGDAVALRRETSNSRPMSPSRLPC